MHTARLSLGHVTVLRGVPATTVGRTIVDCAGVLGPNRLGRLTNQAIHRQLLRLDQVPELWDHARRAPGRHGEVRLREVLEPWMGPITPDSPAEARLRRQLVEWGYPEPELQIPVRDEHGTVVAVIDTGWSPRRLGIEYDSAEFHDPSRWRADEARHRLIESLGWTLLHADKLDLQPGSGALRASLRRAWLATDEVPAR